MLIKCPDCQRKISTDIKRCPSCGCIIDAINNKYEPVIIKGWSPLGIASAVLVLVGPWITIIFYAIAMGFFNPMDDSINEVAFFVSLFGVWNLIPIIQITLSVISLVKRRDAHKWPAIVGIVGASFWIMLFVLIMLLSFS